MVLWMKEVKPLDPKFHEWFRRLLREKRFAEKTFEAHGGTLKIANVLTFAAENWLNDSGMDAIFKFFQSRYGGHKHGAILFIPTDMMSSWKKNLGDAESDKQETYPETWHYEGSRIRSGSLTVAYVFVHTENHWGALKIDFTTQDIHFGDSMHNPAPRNSVSAVIEWLRCNMSAPQFSRWKHASDQSNIKKLPIGDQSGGSCGIIAANAIECDILNCNRKEPCSPKLDLWRAEDSTIHRLRYLNLVIGSPVVCA